MNTIKVISLIDDPDLLIASGKRVFSKEETGALLELQDTIKRIRQLEDSHELKLNQAEELAKKRGRGEGLEQGRQHARQELSAKLLDLEQQNHAYRQSLRDEVASLALKVVRKIANGVAPDAMLLALASQAAAEHLPRQTVTLKVHPDHLEPVKQQLESLNNAESAAKIEHVLPDNELNPSDCILETAQGQICADLETQLLAIEHHLQSTDPVVAATVATA